MMETKKYWFSLKPNVYVEFKENKILLYDTNYGQSIETEEKENIALIAQLYEPENLGAILVQDKLKVTIHKFIWEVVEKKMGDLINTEENLQRPIRLIPILNLQKDIDKHKQHEDKRTFLGRNIDKYLLELNVYLNSTCEKACKQCKNYSKQVRCCVAHNDKNELSNEQLQKLFEQIRYAPIKAVNLLGGDIFKYTHLEELRKLSSLYPKLLHYYIHYENYQRHELIDSQQLELIVTYPIKKRIFQKVWGQVNRENLQIHLIVENEKQFMDAEKIINAFEIKEYEIHPFFTGKNLNFFDENIFLDKDDIFSKTISMREIFRNQKLNSNFFGTLYVMSDGSIKANMNTSILGNLNTDKILDIIYKELIENTAWRVVRNLQPCDKCVYQFFCPALSDYERVIGRNNLCHLKQEK